jgi:hypothetical protein
MVKFSIIRDDWQSVITKNLDTQKEYITSHDTMQMLCHFFPEIASFYNSTSWKVEGIATVELDAKKAEEFELTLIRNPLNGGYRHRKRSHRKRSHRKRSHRKRSHRKRTTRRR